MKKGKWLWIQVICWAMLSTHAQAHLRNYLETYGYDTLEKGHSELELWTDYRNPDEGESYWLHQTEVEYGVTDHYTMGVYGVFREGAGFSALKIENRVRFAERGQWPVDTALYLEYKDANGWKDNDELEAKIILAKDIRHWNFAVNGILAVEKELEATGETEWEVEKGVNLAGCYKATGRITPGLELLIAENNSRLVPGVYVDLAPNIRLNLGVGIGLEGKADTTQLKSILELEF